MPFADVSSLFARLLPELILYIFEAAARSEYPRKQKWAAQSLSCVNRRALRVVEETIYPKLILNDIKLFDFAAAVARRDDSPVCRLTTEIHFPSDMDINRYHGAEWRRLITENVPSLVVLSALPLVFAPYEDEPSRLLNERIARCVQRLRTRIPFTSYKLAVNNHSRMAQVLTSHFDHIRYLHLIIAWDAHPEHVPNFSEFNSLTHVLVDRVPHPAYYRSSNSTIISAVTACLKAPNLERVLVRYPVRLKPDSDIKQGLAQLAIEKDDTRIWLDLDTYSVISDANSVHLEDSMCGLEPFLRGQAVLSG